MIIPERLRMLIFRIGDQHNAITQLMGRLDNSDEPNTDMVARRKVMEQLTELWVDCIYAEEQVMRDIDYSHYRNHSKDHHKLFSMFSVAFAHCGENKVTSQKSLEAA